MTSSPSWILLHERKRLTIHRWYPHDSTPDDWIGMALPKLLLSVDPCVDKIVTCLVGPIEFVFVGKIKRYQLSNLRCLQPRHGTGPICLNRSAADSELSSDLFV